MPPMTSSRPGARLTRIRLPAAGKSADSSPRTRLSSVGTGSRFSKLIAMGERTVGPRRRRRRRDSLVARRTPALEDDLVEEPRLPGVERRHQHVISIVADLRVLQLEGIG